MSLLALSTELLDRIFEHCDPDSIKCSRLANGRLREVANRHLIRELRVYYNRESLDLLTTLATTHQDIAKGIQAIWLQTDRLPYFATYDAWDAERKGQYVNENHASVLDEEWRHELQAHSMRTTNDNRKPDVEARSTTAKVAKDYLDRSYEQYTDLYFQQCELDSSSSLYESSKAFFRTCPKLSSIWITSGGAVRANSTHKNETFRKGLVFPYHGYSQAHNEYARIPAQVLIGALDAGIELDTLVLGNVNYRFLTQSVIRVSRLTEMLKHVRHLHWDVGETFVSEHDDTHDEEDVMYGPDVNESGFDEMHAIFEAGRFKNFIASAVNVRTLVVNLPEIPDTRLLPVDFADVFGNTHFPFLESFSTKKVTTSAADLVGFLLRHRATLTQLRLCDLYMRDGTGPGWHKFFTAIGGKLSCLEKVCLRGAFHYRGSVTHVFGQNLSEYIGTQFSRAMEVFMLRGGEQAPSPRDFLDYDFEEMTKDQMTELAGDALVPEILPLGWDLSWEL